MCPAYTFIGPGDTFMDDKGKMFTKTAEETFVPVQNKYVEAEDRYVEKHLLKKGSEENED